MREYIKNLIREVEKEHEQAISYTHLSNKVDLINNIDDDEEIEKIIGLKDLYSPDSLYNVFYDGSCVGEQEEKAKNEKFNQEKKQYAKDLLKRNLENLIYDEIKYDDFYSEYLKVIEKNLEKESKDCILSTKMVEKITYALSKEEIIEILDGNKFKIEIIFDENNDAFNAIVKN